MSTICDPASGTRFFIPSTNITCVVIDNAGLSSNCSFNVAVTDITPPIITCPSDKILQPTGGFPRATLIYSPTAIDNQGIFSTNCNVSSGTVLNLGSVTIVGCTTVDYAGLTASCSFKVSIIDLTSPSVYCPGDAWWSTNNNALARSNVTYTSPYGTDNSGISYCTCSQASNTVFPLGTNIVSCNCTDLSGNVSPNCTFKLYVYDCCDPSITCKDYSAAPLANSLINNVTWSVTTSDASGIQSTNCSNVSGIYYSLGTTIINCTTVDNFNRTSAPCAFKVNVIDTTNPKVFCPASMTLAPNTSSIYSTAMFAPSANDSSGLVKYTTCSPASGSQFLIGNTTVTCTSTDYSLLVSAPCNFTITVKDTIKPSITCPTNFNIGPTQGFNFAVLAFEVDAFDNSLIQDIICNHPSGSNFSLGFTNVTCYAVDYSNLTSPNCSFGVTVADTIPPVITCPDDILAPPPPAQSYTTVNYQVIAADNGIVTKLTCDKNSGTNFNVGVTKVTCEAWDYVGLSSGPCSFTVTVRDSELPTIFCPPDVSGNTLGGDSKGVAVWANPLYSDNSGNVSLTCVPSYGSNIFPFGHSFVNCTATDSSGNIATCSLGVSIVDKEFPILKCPSSVSAVLDLNANKANVVFKVDSSDNVGLSNTICTPASNSSFVPGSTPVICSATDTSSQTTTCVFSVQVVDRQPPSITCPGSTFLSTEASLPYGIQNWQTPSAFTNTASDNVGVSSVLCNRTSDDIQFPLGTTAIGCTAYDSAGNSAYCLFTVSVSDFENPEVSCPNDIIEVIPADQNWTTINWQISTPRDNVAVAKTIIAQDGVALDQNFINHTYPFGRTYIRFTASDASENQASCQFLIWVAHPDTKIDSTPPTLVCPTASPYTFSTLSGRNYGSVTLPTIGYDAMDVVLWNVTTIPLKPFVDNTFSFGRTTVIQTASDAAGNQAECQYVIDIVDQEPPKITCPVSFVINCNPPKADAFVTWQTPTATDNVKISSLQTTLSSGNTFAAGIYIVTATATDTSGNVATCSFNFTIITDTVPPAVLCPSSQTRNTSAGLATATISWPVPFTSDNRGIASAVYSPTKYSSGASFPLGVTDVQFIVTDLFNNVKTCYFQLIVRDKEPPVFTTCPFSFNVTLLKDEVSRELEWSFPKVRDNVGVDKVWTSIDSGTVFTAGTYDIRTDATDASGNAAIPCIFSISVVQFVEQNSTIPNAPSSASSTSAIAIGGGGAFIVLGLIVALLVYRKRVNNQVTLLEKKYGDGNPDMSDEAVLARAQAIQQALLNRKRNETPTEKWLNIKPAEFRAPPKSLAEMDAFLSANSDRELDRSLIVIESEIGNGEFGSVWSGYLKKPDGGKRPLAIKMLKDASDKDNKLKFLQEASIMLQFNHPKIVALVGVVTKSEPVLICLEFMELGSLRSYLRSELVIGKLTDMELIRMACDVCAAMHYLGESGFIHRDLAARNILINKNLICKVSDFGLSLEAELNEVTKGDKIPIRWTPPEAIEHSLFSTASDVWSYGVLLWEMWSYGEMPYKGWNNAKVIQEIKEGYRMPNPDKCPEFIHGLMLGCWTEDPEDRPWFSEIFQHLLGAFQVCKPFTAFAKAANADGTDYESPVGGRDEEGIYQEPEDEMYDLGGDEGGRIRKRKSEPMTLKPRGEDDDGEDNMYDLGGDEGGQIAKPRIVDDDDDDETEYADAEGEATYDTANGSNPEKKGNKKKKSAQGGNQPLYATANGVESVYDTATHTESKGKGKKQPTYDSVTKEAVYDEADASAMKDGGKGKRKGKGKHSFPAGTGEDGEDDMYDVADESGSKIKKPNIWKNSNTAANEEDDDPTLYDTGGEQGGKIRPPVLDNIVIPGNPLLKPALSAFAQAEEDELMYDVGDGDELEKSKNKNNKSSKKKTTSAGIRVVRDSEYIEMAGDD